MASGVQVDDEGVKHFNTNFRLRNTSKKMFLVYHIVDDSIIKLDKDALENTAECEKMDHPTPEEFLRAHTEMMARCPEDDGRFIIFKFYQEGKTNIDKIIGIMWAPDTATPKRKMIYASSTNTFKKAFTGITYIQVSDKDGLELENLEEITKSK